MNMNSCGRNQRPCPCASYGYQWPSTREFQVTRHSEKPDWQYELIEAYFPTLPKIELNARRRRDGWDTWGLDAPPHDPETGESYGGRGMNLLPVIDDCQSAADVMIRARRVKTLRFEMMRPTQDAPPEPIVTTAPIKAPPIAPPKPEPPIDLPNFLACHRMKAPSSHGPLSPQRSIIRHTAEYFRITVEHLLFH